MSSMRGGGAAEMRDGSRVGLLPLVRQLATDALRYWEPRRLVYDAILVLIVVACFFASWPSSKSALSWEKFQDLFVLAVLANVFYCAAYVVDLFVQLSGFRTAWIRWRWVLLAIGTAFAGIIARTVSIELFSRGGGG